MLGYRKSVVCKMLGVEMLENPLGVTYLVSPVTCHMSQVKLVELVGGGSVISSLMILFHTYVTML